MNASHAWLSTFLDVALTPERMRELITAHCCPVDEIVPLRTDLSDIVVGIVVEAGPHPDADRLTLTKVDAGGGTLLDVVCGAPNVRVGTKYPFAPVGAKLPGGLTIEKRKIRGATSNGMLCSARELQLGEDHEGILALDTTAAPGTPLLRAAALGDVRLVVDVTPNRPDLLSHLGLARELASATRTALHVPAIIPDEGAEPSIRQALERAGTEPTVEVGGVRVTLEDAVGCPRYAAVIIRGLTVGPSPRWLVERLAAVGSRSINNVVDASNFILHEIGQPTHAFDLAKLAGPAIVVRRARAGERLRTLDGVDRALSPDMTVIADADRAQAIAGVMGGAESEVTDSTTDVLLEVAYFDPSSVRRSRRSVNLQTDASYRFERGADPSVIPMAAARAATLIVSLAGGQVDTAGLAAAAPVERRHLAIRREKVSRLLGGDVPEDEIESLLSRVGFHAHADNGVVSVTVPEWRPDVRAEIDLVEEVARLRGYDAWPDTLRPYRASSVPDSTIEIVSKRIRDSLVAMGLVETRAMPFVRGPGDSLVRVVNPLSEAEAYLRPRVIDTLARRAEHNLAQSTRDIRLFEVGSAFEAASGALPHETLRVAVLVTGHRRPPHFTEPKPPDFDQWDAKGIAETLAALAFPSASVQLEPGKGDTLWRVEIGGEVRGWVERVALEAPVWAAPAYGVELLLETADARQVAAPGRHATAAPQPVASARSVVYRPVPTTPATFFDLALVVPDDLPVANVEERMRMASGELLERLELVSEYRGEGVPSGARSVAWRLTFRHTDRTLRDKEIDGRREKLLRTLEGELGVRQRT